MEGVFLKETASICSQQIIPDRDFLQELLSLVNF